MQGLKGLRIKSSQWQYISYIITAWILTMPTLKWSRSVVHLSSVFENTTAKIVHNSKSRLGNSVAKIPKSLYMVKQCTVLREPAPLDKDRTMSRICHSGELHYPRCVVHGGGTAYSSHRNSRQMIPNMATTILIRQICMQAQVINL